MAARLHGFLARVDWPNVEDKGLTAALHFRNVADETTTRAELDDIAARAQQAGFVARYGRRCSS